MSYHRNRCVVSSKTVGELRREGYAVVVFSPEELKALDPIELEKFLIDVGNTAIENENTPL